MPFINMKTTATLDIAKKDALSKELCIITRDCIGKGENWVMTGFEGNASLCFLGSTKDIAYVEVKCYGYPTKPQMNLMTRKVCTLLVFLRNESMLLTSRPKTGDGMTVTSRGLEKGEYHNVIFSPLTIKYLTTILIFLSSFTTNHIFPWFPHFEIHASHNSQSAFPRHPLMLPYTHPYSASHYMMYR